MVFNSDINHATFFNLKRNSMYFSQQEALCSDLIPSEILKLTKTKDKIRFCYFSKTIYCVEYKGSFVCATSKGIFKDFFLLSQKYESLMAGLHGIGVNLFNIYDRVEGTRGSLRYSRRTRVLSRSLSVATRKKEREREKRGWWRGSDPRSVGDTMLVHRTRNNREFKLPAVVPSSVVWAIVNPPMERVMTSGRHTCQGMRIKLVRLYQRIRRS